MGGTGAPTPPIAFSSDPADGHVATRAPPASASTTRCSHACGDACASVTVDAGAAGRSQPGLVAAGDDLGARRPGGGARRGGGAAVVGRGGRGGAAQVCNDARVPVTAAAGRSGVCGASVPLHGGVVLDLCRARRDRRRRRRVDGARRAPGHVRHLAGGHAAGRARRDARPLAPVDRPVDGRRLAGVPRRGPALDPLREDRGHGRSASTSRSPTGTIVHTGGAPRAAVGPDLTQLFVGIRGDARDHHRRPAAAAPGAAGRAAGGVRVRRRSPTGSPPAGGSCTGARRRRCCASTTRSRPTARTRPASATCCSCSTRATASSSTPSWASCAEECVDAGAEVLDDELVGRWMEHRNDVSALEALISRGYVVDTMEIAARWSALPAIYDAATGAIGAVPDTLAASAHLSHSYPDGACLYFTFAGKPEDGEREAYYRAAWDAGTRAVLEHGGALSHHHGVGLNRARFVRDALGRGVRRARRGEGRPRPQRHPQPGQARPPRPLGRPRLAEIACSRCQAGDAKTSDDPRRRRGDVVGAGGARATTTPRVAHEERRPLLPSSPAPGLVEFDADEMAAAALEPPARAVDRRRRTPASTRSGSPTSAARPSCGTAPRASRSGPASAGRTCAPSAAASSCGPRACASRRTPRPPSSSTCSTSADPDRARDLCFGTVDSLDRVDAVRAARCT